MNSDLKIRTEAAELVPFLVRAWWLRDRIGYQDVNFGEHCSSTLPLFALYSDPM
jgi:hypothetical protein